MSTINGKIGVTTENIFPVIKKFLYSDHEIFLREIVANAVDATQKLKAIAGKGEFKGELGELKIYVESDEKANTLSITDRGIGMSAEEIDKYINQIAFSSAGEFLEKYKDQLDSIIGHFGLGFYSAFMVSKKVEIESLSYREGEKGVRWSCDGSPEYTMTEIDRKERGTKITLYLDDDSKEFSQKGKIDELLSKYCKFMPIPIVHGKKQEWKDGKYVDSKEENIINHIEPLWVKTPAEIKDEEYLEFYRNLYPMKEEPLFWIHLNVDYPFNLTGILYFPKISDRMEIAKNRIQLYCNQMFVTDSMENIMPDFLTLLYGVIDSPDIPLNVSRSYLQSDANVKKISTYVTKKVADRLEEISKKNKEEFEKKWDNLKLFIEYGMLTDEKFCERALKFALFKTTDGKFVGYEDYRKLIESEQTDKDKKVVYLYATDAVAQYPFIEQAKNRGYQVLLFDCQLDAHFVNLLETKLKDSRFARVDSDSTEALIPKKEISKPTLKEGVERDLESAFVSVLPKEASFNLTAENLGENEAPIIITQNEFMRRYRQMSQLGGGMNFYGEMPESYTLKFNCDNPLSKAVLESFEKETASIAEDIKNREKETRDALGKIEKELEGKKDEEITSEQKKEKEDLNKTLSDLRKERKEMAEKFAADNTLIHQLCDLALLSNNLLKGKALNDFIQRSYKLIKK